MSWPNKIKPNTTFNGLTSSFDIFSTSMAAANIPIKENSNLEGVNLFPFLNGDKTGNPHENLYWRKLEESGTRHNNFKLIKLKNFGHVLYDLSTDIGETTDLSNTEPEALKLLEENLSNWETKVMQPLWQEEKEWMDVTYHIHQRLMKNKKAQYTTPSQQKKFLKSKK